MFDSASRVSANSVINADICIIGAGPAGITVARRLNGSGMRVVLLESGGFEPNAATMDLNQGAITGEEYAALETIRVRALGGASYHWTGWCRPLEASDFEKRGWIDGSGWPIRAADVAPYYEVAHEICGLGPVDYDPAAWARRLDAKLLDLPSTLVDSILWQFSAPVRFGVKYREELASSSDVYTFMNATAVALEDVANRRVRRVRVAKPDGTFFFVHPERVVLAAGAIETVRLMLASDAAGSEGIGNSNGLVGRFFAEHPHTLIGKVLSPLDERALSLYQWTNDVPGARPAAVRAGLCLSEAIRTKEGLLAASFTLDPSPDNPPSGTGTEDIVHVLKQLYGGDVRVFDLYARTEQAPNPWSRLSLLKDKDRFGLRRIALHWQLCPQTRHTIERGVEIIAAALGRAGVGRVFSYAHTDASSPGLHYPIVGGGFHHMGTTRMGSNPAHGVVDANCRVFDLDNLYVAGSSVFPTSGLANPTLTLVALSARLGDHLRGEA
jgi:choline dehydrogenase-like flavoprotein